MARKLKRECAYPEYLKVGAKTYTVLPVSEEDSSGPLDQASQACGYIDHKRLLVYFNASWHEDQIRDTILHEAIHAAEQHADLQHLEEHEVTALSTTLLAILRDNPKLVAYLMGDENDR